MSKSDNSIAKTESGSFPSSTWQWAISLVVVFHFGAIALTYATNWRRSPVQDQVLTWLQPYLIGANWYHEMLPVELVSEEAKSQHTWLAVCSSDSEEWKTILDNWEGTFDNHYCARLLRLMLDLAEQENTDGLGRIAVSLVKHFESSQGNVAPNSTKQIDRIRLLQPPSKLDESGENKIVFEGDIVRFENGELAFVSKTENRRTVRALINDRGSK